MSHATLIEFTDLDGSVLINRPYSHFSSCLTFDLDMVLNIQTVTGPIRWERPELTLQDKPNILMINWLKQLDAMFGEANRENPGSYPVPVIVTNRQANPAMVAATQHWLSEQGVGGIQLYMRSPDLDHIDGVARKIGAIACLKSQFHIDDREDICDALYEIGISSLNYVSSNEHHLANTAVLMTQILDTLECLELPTC